MPDTFAYCLKNGLLGVGWRVEGLEKTTDWDEFYAEASAVHEKLNVCRYINKWVHEDCLVWTRDPQGNYYMARVLSGWEYFTTDESRAADIDIGNIFRVHFLKLNIDEVPGKVVASFRPRRTMQEIADPTAIVYSKYIWNQYAGTEVYTIDNEIAHAPDIFSLLDSEEVEDLVFLYLQSQGWFVVPHSRKADTLAFEYMVIKPLDGSNAQVQVKTGNVTLHVDDYRHLSFPVILFQSSDLYQGEEAVNVTCLPRTDVVEFLNAASSWLPARYRRKMAMLQGGGV